MDELSQALAPSERSGNETSQKHVLTGDRPDNRERWRALASCCYSRCDVTRRDGWHYVGDVSARGSTVCRETLNA